MGVFKNILHREIRRHIGVHQSREGHVDENELDKRCRHRRGDHLALAAMGANQRHNTLESGDPQGQQQRKMANLGNHDPAPFPSTTPLAFSRSATSFGM